MKKKVIILNHMFTGNYLQSNIGHEIINLFSDDNGKQYVYLCRDGVFNREDVKVEYVVQVRRPDKTIGTLEIINVASEVKVCNKTEECPSPTYGGASIYDIFKHNLQQQDTCVTFEASCMFTPKRPLYIWEKEKKHAKCPKGAEGVELEGYNPSQQLREYIEEGTSNYDRLKRLIENNVNMENIHLPKVNVQCDTIPSVAEIYGIEGRELSYSDAFRYFIEKYPDLFLTLWGVGGDKLMQVHREWKNIDLVVECEKHLLVIENKIFSGLNGKDGNQLSKYRKTIEEAVRNEKSDFYQKIPVYILLLPNHNNIALIETGWDVCRYKEVYDYLERNGDSTSDQELKDFLRSLEPHTREDYNFSIMQKRFVRAIRKVR